MDVLAGVAGNETLGLGLDSSSTNGVIYKGIRRDYGAGGRTRTDMSLRTPDFESGAYTNFATPAAMRGER